MSLKWTDSRLSLVLSLPKEAETFLVLKQLEPTREPILQPVVYIRDFSRRSASNSNLTS